METMTAEMKNPSWHVIRDAARQLHASRHLAKDLLFPEKLTLLVLTASSFLAVLLLLFAGLEGLMLFLSQPPQQSAGFEMLIGAGVSVLTAYAAAHLLNKMLHGRATPRMNEWFEGAVKKGLLDGRVRPVMKLDYLPLFVRLQSEVRFVPPTIG